MRHGKVCSLTMELLQTVNGDVDGRGGVAESNGVTDTSEVDEAEADSRTAEQEGLLQAVSKAKELWKHISVRIDDNPLAERTWIIYFSILLLDKRRLFVPEKR